MPVKVKVVIRYGDDDDGGRPISPNFQISVDGCKKVNNNGSCAHEGWKKDNSQVEADRFSLAYLPFRKFSLP